uniref:Uncharacterized protein n=2 Tax=Timema TaxID=61471 RepID=A0A7R9IQ52_9NEOP|nr:unnamed protein product [Timema bartmani]CAD7462510.1 unnamed protein product [Timema tahoe]
MMPYIYLTNEVMCSQGEEPKEGEWARPTMAVANNSTAPQEQEISEHTKERVLAIEKLMIEQTASRKEESMLLYPDLRHLTRSNSTYPILPGNRRPNYGNSTLAGTEHCTLIEFNKKTITKSPSDI